MITRIDEPVKDFRLFTLEPLTPWPVDYRAGQYLTFTEHTGAQEVRRSYSIISSPVLNEPLAIGVRRLENGSFSRLLFRLKPGDILTSTGTGGFFLLPDDLSENTRLYFFAAGTGITPVFPLIKTALHHFPNISVTIFYSNHSPEHTIFLQALQVLQREFKNVAIEFLFSNNPNLQRARLNAELVFELLEEYSVDTARGLFYLCGPEAYMRMCLFTLREAGVAAQRIRRENFIVRKKEPLFLVPPDQQPHEVEIDIDGTITSLTVQYPSSILATAKRQSLSLPYSCESGVCGNCAATCVSGTVWMSNNEVLTEADLKNRLVLTCTGYPVSGDVLLKIG